MISNSLSVCESLAAAQVGIVIPCFRVRERIIAVVSGLPDWVFRVYVVDDCCPEETGRFVIGNCHDSRIKVLFHSRNLGVGGAMRTGFAAAIADGCEIVVKMDGDGQMDPAYLPRLVAPILENRADFAKGSRFFDFLALRSMPLSRRLGNLGLNVLTKGVSGQWHISDPTNGYFAIHRCTLEVINLPSLSRGYFFETSMLIQLNVVRAVIVDIPIPARYGTERSSLSIPRVMLGFPPRLAFGLLRRLLLRYLVYDMNAVSLLGLAGTMLLFFGVGFGAFRWWVSFTNHVLQSSGTIALALLPTIVGFQMILQAILLDVIDRPINTLRWPRRSSTDVRESRSEG